MLFRSVHCGGDHQASWGNDHGGQRSRERLNLYGNPSPKPRYLSRESTRRASSGVVVQRNRNVVEGQCEREIASEKLECMQKEQRERNQRSNSFFSVLLTRSVSQPRASTTFLFRCTTYPVPSFEERSTSCARCPQLTRCRWKKLGMERHCQAMNRRFP